MSCLSKNIPECAGPSPSRIVLPQQEFLQTSGLLIQSALGTGFCNQTEPSKSPRMWEGADPAPLPSSCWDVRPAGFCAGSGLRAARCWRQGEAPLCPRPDSCAGHRDGEGGSRHRLHPPQSRRCQSTARPGQMPEHEVGAELIPALAEDGAELLRRGFFGARAPALRASAGSRGHLGAGQRGHSRPVPSLE